MRPGPRFTAFIVSILVATIITAFISFVDGVTSNIIVATFIASFLIILISALIYAELFYAREMTFMDLLLKKIENNDLEGAKQIKSFTPMKNVYSRIFSYAQNRDSEVKRLTQMANFRKDFIADISHELKTPIFAAQGFVHTLIDGAVRDKRVREKFLKKAAKSLDRLDILVQDLVTLSQIETGEVKMFMEYFDTLKLAEEVVEEFEQRSKKREIELRIKVDPDKEYLVYADWHRIYQVLINLVGNAMEYTDKGGTVTIELSDSDQQVMVSVIDTGVGIPEDSLPRIFERFYRVDKSRSRAGGGTGLGLAIVKHIIEAHNSQITVESEEGKGSTFSFKLDKE